MAFLPFRKRVRTQVTSEKLRRDATLLHDHAAVVIILNQDGSVRERIVRDPTNDLVVRLIVVLAPVVHLGEFISLSCVLEIGFSRTRPYERTNFFCNGKRYFDISPRKRVSTLSADGYRVLYPELLGHMRAMLFAIREHWGMKEAWMSGPKRIPFEKGVRFTIHHSDLMCCAHFLFEDIRFRRDKYFSSHVSLYKKWMRSYVLSHDRHSNKRLLQLKGVTRVVNRLGEVRYPPQYIREILNRLTYFERELFERIALVAHIPFATENSTTRLIDWAGLQGFVRVEGVHFCLIRDRSFKQGKHALVVEAFFEKEYRKHHEIPF